ncbi:hypothetical protein M413DRAFT_448815 [Hebeloma cylindrosporum]|uniref:Peptide hydrolase n=1 Tax=Hebeloma cylindrosporum TaxID=76867 RepID=A0A0C3BZK6_HEBCY|nr:hypothetical protein M413DRAFT_448815 [Hebeloma cylindrosporum h7]
MTFTAKLFGYRVAPTSLLAFITYFSIFVALFVTDILPSVPSPQKQGDLDLKEAFEDLRHITSRPHPYNSHANDNVRAYILSRLETLALNYPHVHISNDLVSNGSWASPLYGVYFEGTNVLVKVDGTSSDSSGGVLFSAHYDSVSTASGATDDGMGVATLLQLVKYFAENRQPRAAVFNINNGEEDWLNGAHAFLEHPWSELVDVFLNLEGAAAGGRPILFRATSTSPVRAFRNTKLVPHPHANVLSSDAFSRGLIRSGTDFSVYAGPGSRAGMAGLDLAFYKGRSRYHTKYDAVPYTVGGEKSLWSMMEVARGVGIGLLDKPFDIEDDKRTKDAPVYFDVFKSFAVVFSLAKLLTFNIVTLVVGPISLVLLFVCERVLLSPRASASVGWVHTIWRHTKFWIALVVVICMQLLLAWAYIFLNPFAIYSSPYIILFSICSLGYLVLLYTLTLPYSLPFYHSKDSSIPSESLIQKHTIFFHLYAFTWILLVLATLGITRLSPGLGGGYLISIWSLCVGAGCILVVIEDLVSPGPRRSNEYEELEGGVEDEGSIPRRSHHQEAAEVDETTPLISRENGERSGDVHGKVEGDVESLSTWWWIPQFLLSVPIPIILFGHVTMLLLDSMPQTLADGASPWSVYILTSLPALLLVLPIAPFAHKLRPYRPLTMLVWLIFILTTLYALLAFPFSIESPLKIYLQQRVEFPSVPVHSPTMTHPSGLPKVITSLTGPERYLRSRLIPYLPSSQENGKDVLCKADDSKTGLLTCEWDSGSPHMMPVPGTFEGDEDADNWKEGQFFKAGAERVGVSSARIAVKGRNTRSCRVYFDSAPVHQYVVWPPGRNVRQGGGLELLDDRYGAEVGGWTGMQEGYEVGPTGVKEVRLWSRTWGRAFVVDVNWSNYALPDGSSTNRSSSVQSAFQGRIACEWVEYESAMVDHGTTLGVNGTQVEGRYMGMSLADDGRRPKIPALEEVLAFLPDWAVVSKYGDGLVEAWAPFSV